MGLGFARDPLSGALTQNQFAAGAPRYGAGLSSSATSGALSSDGYNERDLKMKARRRALQNRLRQSSGLGTIDPSNTGGY